jgi:putative resolvase
LWKQGQLDAYQLPTGTVIVRDGEQNPQLVHEIACIYARVSSSENKDNLKRQADRLVQYSTARGYRIYKVVEEVGSGLNDNRQKLISVLSDKKFNVLVVEHKDRLTRFGANYIQVLLTQTGRRLEVVNDAANDKEDLMSDFAAVITLFCSRLYGLRRGKRKTEKLIAELQSNSEESCN